ncbi:hypothetical protein A1Q1_05436 [Trichosporon asahii var. asahii CBS 2479]|uniref:Xylanolytic transcriptional activator regulatory domain-containing protein n=1 Tax=Trichosporon asahii var. asahii (strain ATCC 90039 / CBS 2479 / JCM 2466 / KCTC 7840 / NBRC 103889/ NCYC 2677 / UAMH 7654) TaxID=1186058 RepID=J6ENU7_TRIAS|nr:hypothetical protein A1Q1_05436 [Trichosporon asahii var. asahii CBS 2479]EJT46054.1 hypothetical protein A1Q1_05436 [Trichosporon asahii var. asahii CBS 2479]
MLLPAIAVRFALLDRDEPSCRFVVAILPIPPSPRLPASAIRPLFLGQSSGLSLQTYSPRPRCAIASWLPSLQRSRKTRKTRGRYAMSTPEGRESRYQLTSRMSSPQAQVRPANRGENPNEASGPVINEMRERLTAIETMLLRFGERAGRSRSRSRSYDRERDRDRDRRYRRGFSRSHSPDIDHDRGRHRDRERDREHGGDFWSDRGRDRSDRPGQISNARDARDREWEHRRVAWDDRGRTRGTSRDPRDEPRQLSRQPYSTSPIHQRQEPQDNYGTLVIDKSGRSKWLGPTAGTEWLKNVSYPIPPEADWQQELSSSARPRSTSPQTSSPTRVDESGGLFPFPSWGPPPTMDTLTSHLPAPEVARDLLDCYYENYAWNHDVAPRQGVEPIFNKVYEHSDEPLAQRVHLQQLALLFIIFAMGALHNPELPPHHPSAEHHLAASRWCLVKGDFMGVNTVPGLQALVIMAHYHLETEKGRSGDSAWPLWGLAMRLVTAMGLHIDGERWNLPDQLAALRAHRHRVSFLPIDNAPRCFLERQCLPAAQVRAMPDIGCGAGPGDVREIDAVLEDRPTVRQAVYLRAADSVQPPLPNCAAGSVECVSGHGVGDQGQPEHQAGQPAPYIPAVHTEPERERDNHIPATPVLHQGTAGESKGSDEEHLREELSRYRGAMYREFSCDRPPRSAVNAQVIIEVVAGLYECFPRVTARHWFFWYHLFTAAICIGTMIIKNSSNPLSQLALVQIDHAIKLYSSVIKLNPTPSLIQNHQWLLHLRQRALAASEQESTGGSSAPRESIEDDDDDDIDVKLMGWRTRLIQRATAAKKYTPPPSTGVPAQPPTAPVPQLDAVLQQHMLQSAPQSTDMSTDLFFWDPTIMLGSREDAGSNGQLVELGPDTAHGQRGHDGDAAVVSQFT